MSRILKYPFVLNQKINNWTVLSENKINKKRSFDCKCICGNVRSIPVSNLFLNKSTNCGCIANEHVAEAHRKNNLNPGFNRLLLSYKWNAKNRNLEWLLLDEEAEQLFKANCFFCDIEPLQVRKTRVSSKWEFIYNGIDCLDSNKGYIQGNVVTCCGQCNLAKSDFDLDEFYSWIKRLIGFHNAEI